MSRGNKRGHRSFGIGGVEHTGAQQVTEGFGGEVALPCVVMGESGQCVRKVLTCWWP